MMREAGDTRATPVQPFPVRLLVKRIGICGTLVSLSMLLLTLLSFAAVSAQTNAGGVDLVKAADNGEATNELLESGDASTTFQLRLPEAAACSGDSVEDGYRAQSFMVPATFSLDDLKFDANGPTPAGVGANFVQPLIFDGTTPWVNKNTAPDTGQIIEFQVPMSLGVFAQPAALPAGEYQLGFACTVGASTDPGHLDKYWSRSVEVAYDGSDAMSFTVLGGQTPTTTTTEATTTTTEATTTTTTSADTTTTTAASGGSTTTTTAGGGTTTTTAANGATTTTTAAAGSTTTAAAAATTTTRAPVAVLPATQTRSQPTGGVAQLAATGPQESRMVRMLIWGYLSIVFGAMALLASRPVKVIAPPSR